MRIRPRNVCQPLADNRRDEKTPDRPRRDGHSRSGSGRDSHDRTAGRPGARFPTNVIRPMRANIFFIASFVASMSYLFV
jgi:hypothetical protein